MGLTLGGLFAVPLLGVARVDLWAGDHLALGRPVDLARGALAVCLAIGAFPKDAARRRGGWLRLVGFALAVAVALWWVAPGALRVWPAGVPAWGAVAVVAGYAVFHGRRWRWGFCRKACPVGLDYSVVQSTPIVRVDFDPTATCTDCGGCAGVCPVALDPRCLDAPTPAAGGLAVGGFPGANHCLHCGACIEVCEHLTRKAGGPAAMGFRRAGRRRRAVAPTAA